MSKQYIRNGIVRTAKTEVAYQEALKRPGVKKFTPKKAKATK
jgi:hypothetical protein